MSSFLTVQKEFDRDLLVRNISEELDNDFLLTCLYFSQLAYFSTEHVSQKLEDLGPLTFSIYKKQGVQALVSEFDRLVVVAFKGQENDRWQDFKTDLKFWKTDFLGFRVHAGIAESYKCVNRRILIDLDEAGPNKRILYTGHSLGGALSLLLALEHRPTDICTFGSPKVCDPETMGESFDGINIQRVYTENDFVASLPPKWSRYEHFGHEVMLEGKPSSWEAHQLQTYLRHVMKGKFLKNDSVSL